MSATAARRAALRVLAAVREGRLADHALEREAAGLDARDRAWLLELVYGTYRLRGRLDHRISGRVRGGVDRLDPDVHDILRLGVYQLLTMGSVPAYAAVSQSVDLARKAGGAGAARFVNAVLRAISREGPDVWEGPDFASDPVGWLTTWGSQPRWLAERWVRRWGAEAARDLAERFNERPSVFLRPLDAAVDAALLRLAEAGIPADRVATEPASIRLGPGVDPAAALAVVPSIVQDPAAGRVVDYAAFDDDAVVADLCAAPGGKAIVLAARAARIGGWVIAADRSERRLERVGETVRRLSPLPVSLLVADGRQPALRPVDGVLLDVPCTGTGTLGRHPDARWRIGPADLEALVALQRELLEAAASVVRAGGLLVYATCSLEREENEDQVEAFLKRHPEFTCEAGPAPESMLDDRNQLLVLPQRHGFDGAFAARMRRR